MGVGDDQAEEMTSSPVQGPVLTEPYWVCGANTYRIKLGTQNYMDHAIGRQESVGARLPKLEILSKILVPKLQGEGK